MKHEAIRRCLLIAAVAAMLSTGAWAQTVDIPYQGWLTLNDQPCSGDHSMVFDFYDSQTGEDIAWNHSATVTVSNGAFSVVLPVPEDIVIGNPALYLQIAVGGVPLENRQRIYPAMYAARSDMGVDEFQLWSATGTSEAGLEINNDFQNHSNTSEISNDTDDEMALVITGNRSAGGSRQVKIYDELTVGGVNFEGGTFRGMKWVEDPAGPAGNVMQWVISGQAFIGVDYETQVDTGVPVSDGMCILTAHDEVSITIDAGGASTVAGCRIVSSGTPETWRLYGKAKCESIGCQVVGVYCTAKCVRWSW
jgi:hypothetical protein